MMLKHTDRQFHQSTEPTYGKGVQEERTPAFESRH